MHIRSVAKRLPVVVLLVLLVLLVRLLERVPSHSVKHIVILCCVCFFFFNDTATTEIYTLSLHDALPILPERAQSWQGPLEPQLTSQIAFEFQPRPLKLLDRAERIAVLYASPDGFPQR